MRNTRTENCKILVVDDSPMNVELMEATLVPYGYEVICAKSGRDALKLVDSELPDLVLLDVMMPDMNGYETCRRIRENTALPYMPIIFITASEHDLKHIVEGLDAGGDDYLRKPVDPAELFSRIQSNLRIKALYDDLSKTKAELSRYVSLSTLKMVENITGGGEVSANGRVDVTVLFSDIRGFTRFSEKASPEAVFDMLNRNLSEQIRIIEVYKGIIDKLTGDEVMAVFEGAAMAERAIGCAAEIVRSLSSAGGDRRLEWAPIGIGVNSGPVFLGSLGSKTFRDYTIVGKTVNIAARLCGLADRFQVLLTQTTRERVPNGEFHFKSIGEKILKGLSKPIEVFQLIP